VVIHREQEDKYGLPRRNAANNVIAQANMATSMFIVVDPENFNKILVKAGKQ